MIKLELAERQFDRDRATRRWDLNHRIQDASRRVDSIDGPGKALENAFCNANAVPGLKENIHAGDSTAPRPPAASRSQNSK
jgi:hypothetical protein